MSKKNWLGLHKKMSYTATQTHKSTGNKQKCNFSHSESVVNKAEILTINYIYSHFVYFLSCNDDSWEIYPMEYWWWYCCMTMQSYCHLHNNAHHMFCFSRGTEACRKHVPIFVCMASEHITIIELSKKPIYSKWTVYSQCH